MRRLPIRNWLVLALLAVVALPLLAAGLMYQWLPRSLWPDPRERLIWEVTTSGERWVDSAWQMKLAHQLAELNLGLVLKDHAGRELFHVHGPIPAGPEPNWIQKVPAGSGMAWFTGQGTRPALARPVLRASVSDLVPMLTGLTVLLLTLAGVAWFIARAVLKPLAAMSQAARMIAGGELDFAIPPSRAREVAEVARAFSAMGDALRASLQRQSELEAERRLFIGAVAHDLRTPLFSLRGHLEALERGVADNPVKAARYAAVCREKADALERLIADLFAYVRSEYHGEEHCREPVEAGELLRKAAEGMRPLAESVGATFVLDGPTEPLIVEGDPHLLARAVENLLDNAVRHSAPAGMTHVEWRQAGNRLTLTVWDTGHGIAPEDLPHVFAPLYRGEPSRNRRTGGAGLGLTIARRIIEAHGGTLTAANRPGAGAEFTAIIPLAPP